MRKLISFSKLYSDNAVHEIKLRNLLEMRDQQNFLKKIHTFFPPIEVGSITLVDQITLLTLLELVSPKRVFEIGTYQGYSARLFLNNSNAEKVISVDLPINKDDDESIFDSQRVLYDGDYNDSYLRSNQKKTGTIYLGDLDANEKKRLQLIKCDSTKLNYEEQVGNFEFAFIDGGHHYDIVSADTYNVLKQIKKGVVVWHDYSSTIHSDVSRFLNEHAKKNQIFYVLGGLCAFQIIGDTDNV